MSWKCECCGTPVADGFDVCYACGEARPAFKEVVLTRTIVSNLRLSGDVIIPLEYNVIGENAFKDRTDVTSVMFHENVRRIRKNAFKGCSNLTSIINNSPSLEKIGSKAFYDCTALHTDIVAEEVESDAFGTTLDDLMGVLAPIATAGVGDSELMANEKIVEDIPLIAKLGVKNTFSNTLDEDGTRAELVDKNFSNISYPTYAEADISRAFSLEPTDKTQLDRIINKKRADLKIERKLYHVLIDVSTFAFAGLLLVTLFFVISNYLYLFESANTLMHITALISVPFLVFSLMGLLSNTFNFNVGVIVNGIIGTLLVGATFFLYYYIEDLSLIGVGFAVASFISAGLLAVSSYAEYEYEDFTFILSCIFGAVCIASVIFGLVVYL